MQKSTEDYSITKLEAAEVLGICPDGLKDWERAFACRLRKVRSASGDELLVTCDDSPIQIEMEYEG